MFAGLLRVGPAAAWVARGSPKAGRFGSRKTLTAASKAAAAESPAAAAAAAAGAGGASPGAAAAALEGLTIAEWTASKVREALATAFGDEYAGSDAMVTAATKTNFGDYQV